MSELFRQPDARNLPKVSTVQWGLAFLSILLAASSYLLSTYNDLVILALALMLVNLALLAHVIVETLATRLPGKFILVASTIFYFWIGAVDSARQEEPFAVPEGLAINARQFSLEHIQQAFVYITLFQLALLIGLSIQPRVRKLIRISLSRHDSYSYKARVLRYVLAACVIMPLLLSYNLNIGNTIVALLAARGEVNVEARDIGLLHFLLFFGMFGAALFLVEAFARRSLGKLRNLLIGVITILPFVLSGTRHIWLYLSLPTCILVFRQIQSKLTLMRLLRWCALVLAVMLVMQLQYAFRTSGWGETQAFSTESLTEVEVTGQFTALLYAEYLIPETHDYFMEPAEPYFIIHWIPRKLWPNKPIMESWSYFNDSYVQGGAYNVTPSIIGQFHMSFGIYGVIFIGIWLGFLASVADRLLNSIDIHRQCAMIVVIGMFYAFIISSFRFYSPIYFAYFLFGVIAMWAITRRNPIFDNVSDKAPLLGVAQGATLIPRR